MDSVTVAQEKMEIQNSRCTFSRMGIDFVSLKAPQKTKMKYHKSETVFYFDLVFLILLSKKKRKYKVYANIKILKNCSILQKNSKYRKCYWISSDYLCYIDFQRQPIKFEVQ
jgi:hypothetical protein